MEAVVIIPAKEWEEVKQGISSLAKRIKELSVKDPLLTSQEVQEYLKKGSTWVDAHKHDI